MNKAVKNAIKRSLMAEKITYNSTCGDIYELSIIKTFAMFK